MPAFMSMEDLFYGPPEPTFIVPTPDEAPPRRYIEREIKEREIIEPPRRMYKPEPPHSDTVRYIEPKRIDRDIRPFEPQRGPVVDRDIRPIEPRRGPVVDRDIRPIEPQRAPVVDRDIRPIEPKRAPDADRDIRPIERRPEPIVDSDIRPIERLARIHTVPEPVPATAPHEEIRKVVEVPVPVRVEVPVPVRVEVPVPVEAPPRVVHVPAPSPPVEVAKRSITPPVKRPVIHHPIELKVPMCCEKCAKKVKDRVLDLEGVENVVTDQYNQKVTVYGHADPERVLNRVKMVKKRSAFWDMTVDYSKEYRRFREAQAEAARADAARAEAVKAEAKARAKAEAQAKALAPAPAPPVTVIVNLPQERHEPKVTAILPAEQDRAMPYVAQPRVRSHRYVSPPKAYRQELHYGHRQDERTPLFYNGRHADPYY